MEYMEPFIQAARAVLEDVSKGRAVTGPLSLLGTTFPTAATNIAARIDGELSGDVVYSMSGSTAQRLSELLTGAETHRFGRAMGSGLSQLGAMLALRTGQKLSDQGHRCEVGSPIVFQGLNVEFTVTEPALAVPIETDAGEVYVSVAVSNGKQS